MSTLHAHTDGVTVWVDSVGFTVARFGKMGIDVHTPNADGCLHCRMHDTSNYNSWIEFVNAVAEHYDFEVPMNLCPLRCFPPWHNAAE